MTQRLKKIVFVKKTSKVKFGKPHNRNYFKSYILASSSLSENGIRKAINKIKSSHNNSFQDQLFTPRETSKINSLGGCDHDKR